MSQNFLQLVLLNLIFCWVSGVLTSLSEGDSKDVCPNFLLNDASIPCWTLNAKCYCFSTEERLNWEDADRTYQNEGMTLLSLETYEEDLLINNHIKATPELTNDYYWTAGRYSQEGNNRWEWATVEPYQPIDYSNWFPGEPSNNAPGSFVYMNYIFDNGVWFDEKSTPLLFICESMDEVSVTTSTTPKTTTTILDSTTPEVTSTTERTTTEELTTNQETSTTEKATTTEEATTNQETTTTEITTTSSTTYSPGFVCPEPNGNFEIPGNCTSFYNCMNGVATVENCPPGTAFNPDFGACDFPFNVPGCSLAKEEESRSQLLSIDSSFQCLDNGNWPHPTRCDYFYICYGDRTAANKLTAHLRQCKSDSLYDAQHRTCRNSIITDCGDRAYETHSNHLKQISVPQL